MERNGMVTAIFPTVPTSYARENGNKNERSKLL